MVQVAAANSNLKNVTLELGGKSPVIVYADADLDLAVEAAHQGLFFNAGQCCAAGSRTYIQAEIYDEFVRKCVARARSRVVGDPMQAGVEQGPQVSQLQLDSVLSYIETGKREGARLCCGGHRHGTTGYFIEPTVFADVTDDMTIAREEIFGPVQTLLKFETVEESIERANNSEYGLASAVFTNDLDLALKASQQIRAGTLWAVSYTHLRAHETPEHLVCRLLLEKKKKNNLIEQVFKTKTSN
eukprot:TRINITY_DN45494_c0_g1_i1.p1 TRINITY_DN45494_c0_g1~~TRINITY_DN45494_c0_g1_i1.p1  ORF type:complete len:243 (-),score=70.30 TRINITY_DN45494_c0_g1_i1:54-782(-)